MLERGCQLAVEELLKNYPLDQCGKHTERSLELYCNTCRRTVCVACSVDGTHRTHDRDEVSPIAYHHHSSIIIIIIIIATMIIIRRFIC